MSVAIGWANKMNMPRITFRSVFQNPVAYVYLFMHYCVLGAFNVIRSWQILTPNILTK